jgi:hypothetical protein
MPIAGPKPSDALPDDEVVIRRVPTLHPRADGKREVSKGSFAASSKSRDPEEGMSVDLASVLVAMGIDPADPTQFAPEFEVLMTLKVGDLHAHGMWVVPRTQPHPAHCNVLGVTSGKRKIVFGLAQFLRCPADVVKAGE